MPNFEATCEQCGDRFVLPASKQGAHVNCPACGHLQSVGRAADVAWFWGGTLGCYGVLAILLGAGLIAGLVTGSPGLWITMAVLLGIATIVLIIILTCS